MADDDERDQLVRVEFMVDSDSSDYDMQGEADSDANARVGESSAGNEKPDISYDTSLPAQHSYLGTNLEELSGRVVLDDDTRIKLPLVALPGIVLVPGQTLPLHLFNPSLVSMVKKIIEKDRTFGMVNCRYQDPEVAHTLASIGTTAEIRSFREEEDEASGISSIRVKAEGRQRFKVIETWRQVDGCLMAEIQILPEVQLSEFSVGARLNALDRFRILPKPSLDRVTTVMEQTQAGVCVLKAKPSRKKYDRFNFANYTWWPPWVYKQYDACLLMQRVKKELSSWGSMLSTEIQASQNPSEFSFWVAANLPLDDNLRLSLLSLNSPVQRLRCALSILEKCTVLCCKHCEIQIANRHDIFSMSLEGPQGTYVNPSGYVHETITVYKAQGLMLWGAPSSENSWFPGYAWTVVNCRNCRSHMGWKFSTLDEKSQPDKFWGLCRSALEQGLSKTTWKAVI